MRVPVREQLTIPAEPERLFELIASEEGFLMFEGYGPIPGLSRIEYDSGGFREAGSTALVTNTDGSTHREEILECQPPNRYRVRIHSLSSSFRLLVRAIEESWSIEPTGGGGSRVERVFTFVLRSPIFWPLSLPLAHGLFRAAMRKNHECMIARLSADRASAL